MNNAVYVLGWEPLESPRQFVKYLDSTRGEMQYTADIKEAMRFVSSAQALRSLQEYFIQASRYGIKTPTWNSGLKLYKLEEEVVKTYNAVEL